MRSVQPPEEPQETATTTPPQPPTLQDANPTSQAGDVVSAPATETPAQPPTEPGKPWWRRLGPVLTAGATVLGAVIGVIQVWPLIFSDSSSLNTLETVAKPYRPDEVAHYVLPLMTDFTDFPFADAQCGDEQLNWLDSKGRRFQRDYIVQVRNTAQSGAIIALQNFHAEGDLAQQNEGMILECDRLEGSGVVTEPAQLRLDTDVAAYFDKSKLGNAGTGQPNMPLGYNLAPGETGQIVMSLSSIADFSGTLMVSGAVGKESGNLPIALEGGEKNINFLGASTSHQVMLRIAAGRLECDVISTKESFVCDISQLTTGSPQ